MEPGIFPFCLEKDGQVLHQLALLAELSVSWEDYLGQLESGLGSVSWLPTTEVIPKRREAVVREPGGSSVVLRGFPFQDGTKAREI